MGSFSALDPLFDLLNDPIKQKILLNLKRSLEILANGNSGIKKSRFVGGFLGYNAIENLISDNSAGNHPAVFLNIYEVHTCGYILHV